MLSHNQIKHIQSLKIKKYRQQHGMFIVEGEKNLSELLQSQLDIECIYATSDWINANKKILQNIEYIDITETELKKISELITPNKVLSTVKIPQHSDSEIDTHSMMLLLDGISDPGNLGTMIRTADWFGISQIICSTDCVDCYNSKVVQATMGSFSRVKVFYTDLNTFLIRLPNEIPIYGALLDAPEITKTPITQAGAIIIGSESHGISPDLIPHINYPLHIPRFQLNSPAIKAESLNASVANGIICYEICKQLFNAKKNINT